MPESQSRPSPEPQPDQHLPVTVVLSRRPAAGRQEELVRWAAGVTEAARTFAGHRGAQIFPPTPERDELIVAFSFADAAALSAWEHSEVRRAWLDRAAPLLDGPARAYTAAGFESLFGELGAPHAPPPRWKTAAVIAVALYPASLVVNLALGPLIADWPPALRVLVSVVLIVPWMVWLGVPWATRLLRRWLSSS